MKRIEIDEKTFKRLYLEENLSRAEMASYFKCKLSTIDRTAKKLGISKTLTQLSDIRKQSCINKYGFENVNQVPEIHNKVKNTCISHYGVDNPMKCSKIQEQVKATCISRYGVDNPSKSKEIIAKIKDTQYSKYNSYFTQTSEYLIKTEQTNLRKYGVKNTAQVKDFCIKAHKTKKANNSYRKSKQEDLIFERLIAYFPDVIRQYSDRRYPFPCDFYIPSLDLFIEYQGYQGHGKEPFNPKNLEHRRILNTWKQKAKESKHYQSMIKYWTILDPAKRKIAQDNNLNFIEIWKSDLESTLALLMSSSTTYKVI